MIRSGLAFGLAMATFDLLLDRSHDWRLEAVKFAFLSLFFGLVSGALSWDAALRRKRPSASPFLSTMKGLVLNWRKIAISLIIPARGVLSAIAWFRQPYEPLPTSLVIGFPPWIGRLEFSSSS